jgi:hypothetical protein
VSGTVCIRAIPNHARLSSASQDSRTVPAYICNAHMLATDPTVGPN